MRKKELGFLIRNQENFDDSSDEAFAKKTLHYCVKETGLAKAIPLLSPSESVVCEKEFKESNIAIESDFYKEAGNRGFL